jgi:hypothetical protein
MIFNYHLTNKKGKCSAGFDPEGARSERVCSTTRLALIFPQWNKLSIY